MKQYEFTPHERRVIMSAIAFVQDYAEEYHRIRLTNLDKIGDRLPEVHESLAGVLNRFDDDTCWDKLEDRT